MEVRGEIIMDENIIKILTILAINMFEYKNIVVQLKEML